MTTNASHTRPSRAARSLGYTVAAVVNTTLLYLINARPGWAAVPFLTGDTRKVLLLVNLSLVVGIVTNLVYVSHDGPGWRAVGELVANGVALAAVARVWAVFPFVFSSPGWVLVAQVVLATATIGAAIAVLVQAVAVIRQFFRRHGPARFCH
ncbi:hypothetical protein [Actinoplanes sp. NPDC049599]|uniref:hypothetical protein n=1 Tax=Actinoplanes sp. NPDC049599 TaxID=3363903 RepID=UPI00378F3A97